MTHAEMDELYELYALGVLEAELGAEIDKHLEEKCSYCVEHVRKAFELLATLPEVTEAVQPPAGLRRRLLASVSTTPKRRSNWVFAVAGLSAAAAGLLIFSLWSATQAGRTREQLNVVSQERDRLRAATADLNQSQQEATRLRNDLAALTTERDQLRSAAANLGKTQAETVQLREQLAALTKERDELRVAVEKSRNDAARFSNQLASLTTERDQLRASATRSEQEAAALREESATIRSDETQFHAAVEILSRPRTRNIGFGKLESIPHGHVFLNPEGLVLIGAQAPTLPSDRTFELWLMPVQGAPEPVGLFRPAASGQFVFTSARAIDTSQIKAIAVSIEPRQGSSAPTTKPILIVPLG